MSRNNRDYLDDPEIINFNENLNARAAQQMEEGTISPLMFGRTGTGSPDIELRPDYMLFRDAARARRKEGFADDNYLKNPRMVPINEQQKKEAEDEKRLDAYLDNMYKEEKKVAEEDARLDAYLDNMYEEMKTKSKKGGARKRSIRRRSRRSMRRSKRSMRRTRRNKRSRKGRK
jgi:hypothetical protein